jgi:excisionase family DNA binding protein
VRSSERQIERKEMQLSDVNQTNKSLAVQGVGEKPWLTVKEAARHANVSADTIYAACERNELRNARISGRRAIRIKPEWVDQWLEQHAMAQAA